MASVEGGVLTSIYVALALVHHGAVGAFPSTPVEDEPTSVSSLSTKRTDVMLVSYEKPWNEEHASFARRLGGPITTWRVPNEALDSYVGKSIMEFKKPVLVAADPGESFEAIRQSEGGAELPLSTWLFVRQDSQILTDIWNSWRNFTTRAVVGVLVMNSTVIKSIFWPHDFSTDHNYGSKEMLGKLRIPSISNVNHLNGKQLTVACTKWRTEGGIYNACDEKQIKNILELLIAVNVTVKQLDLFKEDLPEEWGLRNSWNIALFEFVVRVEELAAFDVPLFFLRYETFASRVDCHRVITLLEAASESWRLLGATVLLLVLVALVSVAVGEKGWSALRRFSDAAMFLLAAVLGTSAVEPNVASLMAVPRKSLLGLWILAILPLSVYFRSELTSMLTLTRPPYRIDTLEKLELALDRNEVAPCVIEYSTQHADLNEEFDNGTEWSLMKKLQFAFARHGDEALAEKSFLGCLQCALRRDRVCLASAGIMKPFFNQCPNVGPFVEEFKVEPRGYHMLKFHELYEPLKILFLAAQEHGLIDRDAVKYDYGKADNEFSVSGLFVLQVILYAASCLVLLLEILVARCLRHT